MSNSAIKFGAIGRIGQMFGAMGGNPSINALTNANAMAAQQAAAGQANLAMQGAAQPTGSGMVGDMSQMVMDASMPTFDPSAQMAGMGIFGSRNARRRALMGTPLMGHDEALVERIEAEIKDIKANGEDSKFLNEGEDPQDAVYERQSRVAQEKKKHKENDSAAKMSALHNDEDPKKVKLVGESFDTIQSDKKGEYTVNMHTGDTLRPKTSTFSPKNIVGSNKDRYLMGGDYEGTKTSEKNIQLNN
tara:strand:- start:3169 stop:3906 length:738 start_codon:yes stop_codon:yes gene_type:complete